MRNLDVKIAVKELSKKVILCLFLDLCVDHIPALLQRNGVQVWDINECHKCQRADCEMRPAMLKKMHKAMLRKRLTDKEAVSCYHVLYCTKCQVFMQRDVNASLNILLLMRCELEGRARPEYLSRNT